MQTKCCLFSCNSLVTTVFRATSIVAMEARGRRRDLSPGDRILLAGTPGTGERGGASAAARIRQLFFGRAWRTGVRGPPSGLRGARSRPAGRGASGTNQVMARPPCPRRSNVLRGWPAHGPGVRVGPRLRGDGVRRRGRSGRAARRGGGRRRGDGCARRPVDRADPRRAAASHGRGRSGEGRLYRRTGSTTQGHCVRRPLAS